MKSIASLMSVSLFALALSACGSPAEKSDAPVAANDAAVPQVAATAGEATPVLPADSAAPAPLASASASPAPIATPTPTASVRSAAAPAAATVAATAAKPPIFAVCGACHAVAPGKDGIGPSLAGVFNAKAGHAATHTYSDAMKNSGLIPRLSDQNLWAHLRRPKDMMRQG